MNILLLFFLWVLSVFGILLWRQTRHRGPVSHRSALAASFFLGLVFVLIAFYFSEISISPLYVTFPMILHYALLRYPAPGTQPALRQYLRRFCVCLCLGLVLAAPAIFVANDDLTDLATFSLAIIATTTLVAFAVWTATAILINYQNPRWRRVARIATVVVTATAFLISTFVNLHEPPQSISPTIISVLIAYTTMPIIIIGIHHGWKLIIGTFQVARKVYRDFVPSGRQ